MALPASELENVGHSVFLRADGKEAEYLLDDLPSGPEYWWVTIPGRPPAPFWTPGTLVTLDGTSEGALIPEALEFEVDLEAALEAWLAGGPLELVWVPGVTPGAAFSIDFADNAGTSVSCWYEDDGEATFDFPLGEGATDYHLSIERLTATTVESPALGRVQVGMIYSIDVVP